MELSSPRRARKLYRYPAARAPVGEADVSADGRMVRFSAPNGENYEVDLVKMRQRNSAKKGEKVNSELFLLLLYITAVWEIC